MPLEIRPIEPGDKAALAAALEHSSSEAIRRRFLGPHGPLSPAELRYLTEVDHEDHEALIAVDPASGEGVGVGKSLVRSIARHAVEQGVVQFTALMLADNQPMRHLLADLGAVRILSREAEAVELAVDLGVED